MNLSFMLRCLAIAVIGTVAIGARAATVWNEASDGDLSNDGLSPTTVAMSIGSNHVLGTTGTSGQVIDRDYFRFTVPAGAVLSSIILLGNTQTAGVSFIGIQPGPQLTVTPSGGGVEQLIGLGHFGNGQIGTDLLPIIKIGPSGPLPSGTYSVWVQELSGPIPYGFDFVISSTGGNGTSVPTMPEWGMLLLGILLAGLMWRHAWKGARGNNRTGPDGLTVELCQDVNQTRCCGPASFAVNPNRTRNLCTAHGTTGASPAGRDPYLLLP